MGGAQTHSSASLLQDVALPDRYRIVRRIALGGMATVWCANDLVLGRDVAIKLLAEQFAYDERAVRRFQREARAAAQLSGHPHVVTIYDVGQTTPLDWEVSGRPFIVMEHLAGGTVADALRVGAVTRGDALRWLREAAAALDYAHGRGIVHRDIKPGNLLLDGGRRLHVADFGIAQIGTEDTITGTGQLFGTAAYLSPEQALGQPASEASDRYALAVVGFELLVGERPFTAKQFAAHARQHIDEDPPRASSRNRKLPAAGGPFRVFCCRDRQPELQRRFFDRDRLPLPAGTRPGTLSGHYTRLPVVRGPRTSAGPSAFVLSFSGLPNLGTQQISRGETLRFRRDRVATTPPARQVQGIAAEGQLAQPRNALRRFTFVRDHNTSMAFFRPALTEARQPNQPPASRPVNSGPRPCLFDVGFPLSGLQDRIHTSDLNVRTRHTSGRPPGDLHYAPTAYPPRGQTRHHSVLSGMPRDLAYHPHIQHEQVETTQMYLHADLAIKERALARTKPLDSKPGRYRPPDALLGFLDGL